jgi:hypothetical protein
MKHINLEMYTLHFNNALLEGGEKILKPLTDALFAKRDTISKSYLNAILSNKKYNNLSFFERLLSQQQLSSDQLLLIIKHKNPEVVKLVFQDIEIQPEYCHQALLSISDANYNSNVQDYFNIVKYLFSRYSGKLDFVLNKQLYSSVSFRLQKIISEKLTNIECMMNCIFYLQNVNLFERFVLEVPFEDNHYYALWQTRSTQMLKIYLEHRSIPKDKHMLFYANMGEIFYTTMLEMKQELSRDVIKKRNMFLRRQEQKEQRERERKRMKLN